MTTSPGSNKDLDRALRGTLFGLWAEGLARAFWPFVTAAMLLWAALAFGVQDLLPSLWAAALGLGGLASLLMAFIWGAWRITIPSRLEAARRLDQSLPGRPLATMADQVAVGADDAGTQALWTAHKARVARVLAAARAVPGDLRLARFDRFGLRYRGRADLCCPLARDRIG